MNKKEDSLFVSTQKQAALQPTDQLKFTVEDTFKCPIYRAYKPEWIKQLNKASDPIIKRVENTWRKGTIELDISVIKNATSTPLMTKVSANQMNTIELVTKATKEIDSG